MYLQTVVRDGRIIMGIITTLVKLMERHTLSVRGVLGVTGLLVVRVVGMVIILGLVWPLLSVGVGQARLCFIKK
jgi:hypothetical protein